MKKIIAVLICLLIFSTLQGCLEISEAPPETSVLMQTTTDTTGDIEDYTNIQCREPKGYDKKFFALSNDYIALRLTVPNDWEFTQTDEGFAVIRDGNPIGNIILGGNKDGEELKFAEANYDGLNVKSYLNKVGDQFRRRYIFKYDPVAGGISNGEQLVTLDVEYSEMSEFSNSKILHASYIDKVRTIPNLGSIPLGGTNGSNSILLLGNSFINSSNIGFILQNFVTNNNKNYDIEAISRGYATVATYINDPHMMSNIRKGQYSAVFICGFYNYAEVDNLAVLKEACDFSRTKLVIFPAHNENASVISGAASRFKELDFLNWKGEIDYLIRSGIDFYDFCINDQHNHSTALAGYVGAQMIYRSVFGEMPINWETMPLSVQELQNKLGIYLTTGTIRMIQDTDIIYLDVPFAPGNGE